jgi:acetyl esterase
MAETETDPVLEALWQALRAARVPRVLEPTAMRASAQAMIPMLNAGAPTVASEREIQIDGPAGPLRARVFTPPGSGPHPGVVYYHGGGYVIMSPETHAKLAKEICIGAGAVVVSVDYRMAPEHPYPAPVDDGVAAWRWIQAHAAELDIAPQRLGVAGDSAGGNLSASVCLRLRDAGAPLPQAAVLICPWLDMELASDSVQKLAPEDPILDTEVLHFFRDAYVRPEQRREPYASPVHAELHGLPRTLLVVALRDPLRDEAFAFADKLRKAGGEIEVHSHRGMPHAFPLFPGIPQGPAALRDMSSFLRGAL